MGVFVKKSTAKSVLLFSVESGRVGAGIAFVEKGKTPVLAYAATVEIPFQENLEFERLVAHLKAALSRACEKVVREGLPHIAGSSSGGARFDEIHVFYGSPWYLSQTRTVEKKSERPFEVSMRLLGDLVRLEVGKMMKAYGVEESGSAGDTPVIIEQNIVDIRLNGYQVTEPYGKEAREISMAIFASIMSGMLQSAVEDTLARHVRAKSVSHHTLASALFSGVRDHVSREESFLLLETSAEVTDLFRVVNGSIADAISFPMGGNTIIRTTAASCGVLPEEAASILKSTHSKTRGACDAEFARQYEAWRREFEAALGRLPAGELIPHDIFLLVDAAHVDFFAAAIKSEGFGQGSRTLKPFSITALTPALLKPFCGLGGGAPRGDAALMLATLYVQKLL